MKKLAVLACILSLLAGATAAQTCSAVPNNLTNGTTADATQVMANFSYALNCINGLRGYLGGLTMSNDGISPHTVIDSSAGVADSDDATTMMTLAAFTKNANAGWVSGAGNGCLDSGSALATNMWYHLFVIARTDTGAVDELCSTSATSPNTTVTGWPSGNTKKRRIGSFKTDGSAHILAFVQSGDQFLWPASFFDVNATIGTSASTFTISIPSGVNVTALVNGAMTIGTSGNVHVTFYSPLQTGSINGGSFPLFVIVNSGSSGQWVGANTQVLAVNGQIKAISDQANTTLYIQTYGWMDTRGRFN